MITSERFEQVAEDFLQNDCLDDFCIYTDSDFLDIAIQSKKTLMPSDVVIFSMDKLIEHWAYMGEDFKQRPASVIAMLAFVEFESKSARAWAADYVRAKRCVKLS